MELGRFSGCSFLLERSHCVLIHLKTLTNYFNSILLMDMNHFDGLHCLGPRFCLCLLKIYEVETFAPNLLKSSETHVKEYDIILSWDSETSRLSWHPQHSHITWHYNIPAGPDPQTSHQTTWSVDAHAKNCKSCTEEVTDFPTFLGASMYIKLSRCGICLVFCKFSMVGKASNLIIEQMTKDKGWLFCMALKNLLLK